MKKALYLLIIFGIVLTTFSVASHHFRYDLYDVAIQFESEKAKLNAHHKIIQDQHYYYLSRENASATEVVILLHGFSANKENWLRFSQQLPMHYQVHALDLLGHGRHAINLNDNYSIEKQVAYLRTFITETIKQPVHIVGNSMGGAIASLYASRYPNDVKTLFLISPAGVHQIPSDMDIAIEETGENPLIASSIEEFFEVVDFVMEDQPFIPSSILTVQAEESVKRFNLNQKIFSDIRQDLDKNLEQGFSLISANTLILWGKQDRVIHSGNIQRYAELIPNAQKMLLDNVGHLAMIEAPELAAKAFINLSSSSELTRL